MNLRQRDLGEYVWPHHLPTFVRPSSSSMPTHLLKSCRSAAAKTGLPVPVPISTKVPPGVVSPPYLSLSFIKCSAKGRKVISPYTSVGDL